MSFPPEQLFRAFFAELEACGVPYVILHSYDSFPERITSDVDYAVRQEDLQRIPPILREVTRRAGWQIVQTLRYDLDAYYSILMDAAQPERFIKLDGTSHYTDNGCRFVPVTVLLDGRRQHNGFYVPRPSAEFIYSLAKVFAKKKDLAEHLPRLRELWSAESERSQQLFAQVFGPEAGDLRDWFERPAQAWLPLSEVMHARNRYRLPQRLREWGRRAQRVLHPHGLCLAFFGPDGVGKSATIARVQQLQEPCFRRQRLYHFRPRLFQKSKGAPVTQPHAQPPRSAPASWAKVLWYFCDHWLGWLFQQLPAWCGSTGIVFDRHFDDVLVDPRRYRLQRSAALARGLRRCLPRPDLAFILDAPAEVIRQRKPELPVEELERQRAALRQLAARDPRYHVVSTEPGPDEVARAVCRHVVAFLAERERKRMR